MAKENKKLKKNKNNQKYNADNEIIIGVTTKPKVKKVRAENKTARTNNKSVKQKGNESKNKRKNETKANQNRRKPKQVWDEQTKEKEIRRRNRKRMIISIFMLLIAVIGGTIYFLTTPAFNIANIEIIGNEKNTTETYISLSQIELGTTNIFSVTNQRIKNNIKENAYVEDVSIKRKLPDVLQILIKERKVAYQVEFANTYLYLNDQGYLLEISKEKINVPVVKGLSITQENVKVGNRLEEEDLKKLSIVLEFTNYCKYHSIENTITTIDVTDTNNYMIYFEKDQKILYIGNASNLNERLSLLKAILTSEKGKKGEIFMNNNITEDKVYFRENNK